jgi:hypothetical protein
VKRKETELASRKKKEKGEWDGFWESCPGSVKLCCPSYLPLSRLGFMQFPSALETGSRRQVYCGGDPLWRIALLGGASAASNKRQK